MIFRVVVLPLAERDLEAISDWVEDNAGRVIADRYDMRIRKRIASLDQFPGRGTPNPAFGPNIRTIPFESRLTIMYEVSVDEVLIRRVFSTSRDIGTIEVD